MSLINQMLQDLEKRQPGEGDGASLPLGVMSANEPKKRPKWYLLLIAVGALVLVAGLIYQNRSAEKEKLSAESIASLLPPPVAVPLPPVEAPISPAPPASQPQQVAPTAVVLETKSSASEAAKETAEPRKMSKQEKRKAEAERKQAERAARNGDKNKETQLAKPAGKIEKTATQSGVQEQAEAMYRQGVTSFSLGRSTDSIEKLRQALVLDSGHAGARQLLVKQLLEQRNQDEARNTLREGLRQHPAQWQWASYLARLELERNDSNAARQVIDAALPQAANSADFQSLAGAVAQRQGKPGDAADFYRNALRLKPGDGRAWVGLAMSLEAEGHAPEAKEAFKRALTTESLSGELQALAERKSR